MQTSCPTYIPPIMKAYPIIYIVFLYVCYVGILIQAQQESKHLVHLSPSYMYYERVFNKHFKKKKINSWCIMCLHSYSSFSAPPVWLIDPKSRSLTSSQKTATASDRDPTISSGNCTPGLFILASVKSFRPNWMICFTTP